MDSILFDLDGTMWDTTEVAAMIWSRIASEYPDVRETVTAARLRSLYGLPLREIAKELFPGVSEERAISITMRCVTEQCPYLTEHGAILLGDIAGTLQKLSARYRLFVVSNCEDGYIQAFLTAHRLWDYFTDFTCPGQTGLLKAENIRLIVDRYHLQAPLYVGDTYGDQTAAEKADVPFAFAAYGFGTATRYDYRLNSFEDLTTLFL